MPNTMAQPRGTESVRDRQGINFYWLLRLRWWAAAGQALVVLLVQLFLPVELPLWSLFGLLGVSVVSIVASSWWARRHPSPTAAWIGGIMAFDVLLLTAMLYLTGGPSNPFSFLYLVHIALAAVVLPVAWTWALSAFSLSCFGFLFWDHVALSFGAHAGHAQHFEHLHLQGMWVAFGVASVFIVYFVQRVTRALEARELELALAREMTARHERLASLATLAAGAAHELATPLSTIAVVTKELERSLEGGGPDGLRDDVRLIREQVQRCRTILDQMAADAGETAGESLLQTSAETLVTEALEGLPDRGRVAVRIAEPVKAQSVTAPVRAVAQALRGLLKNAVDASPAGAPIELSVVAEGSSWVVRVVDQGPGMPAEILSRVGEPFFTTKAPGAGMGLGLFLARAVLERLGGKIELESRPGEGSTATLVLPGARATTRPIAQEVAEGHG